jgi:hypothetical protein
VIGAFIIGMLIMAASVYIMSLPQPPPVPDAPSFSSVVISAVK